MRRGHGGRRLRISYHKLDMLRSKAKFKNWTELAAAIGRKPQQLYKIIGDGNRDVMLSTIERLLLAFHARGVPATVDDIVEWIQEEEEDEEEKAPAVA